MAFQLTKFRASSEKLQNVSPKRGVQRVALTIACANTDTSLDLGHDAGTFWTAVTGDATYGSLATQAQTLLQNIIANADQLLSAKSEAIEQAKCRVASAPAAGQFVKAVSNHRPEYTFAATDAPTAIKLVLEYELADGVFPVTASLG